MNEELTDAIVESVHDIFHGFLRLEVFPGEQRSEAPLAANDGADAGLQETATVVGFSGVLRGAVVLRAARATALILCGALAGKRFEGISGESLDLLGELVDLIAGGMRTRLSSHGEICLAPPVMVVGNRYTVNNARIYSRVRQTFQVSGGQFSVECFFLKDFA